MRDMQVQQLPTPRAPPVTKSVITVSQVFQKTFTPTAGGTSRDFIVRDLVSMVPGGMTFWNKVRFEKIEVWLKPISGQGSSTALNLPQMSVTIPGNSDGAPPMTFQSNAIDGQTLPAVSFKLGLRQRIAWYTPTVDDVIFSANHDDSDPHQYFVVVTFGLLSNQA